MATPNYGYEKRQRELAKKKKKEEKALAKSQRKSDDPAQESGQDGIGAADAGEAGQAPAEGNAAGA